MALEELLGCIWEPSPSLSYLFFFRATQESLAAFCGLVSWISSGPYETSKINLSVNILFYNLLMISIKTFYVCSSGDRWAEGRMGRAYPSSLLIKKYKWSLSERAMENQINNLGGVTYTGSPALFYFHQ
jgi:hypothetical protein